MDNKNILKQAEIEFLNRKRAGTLPEMPKGKENILSGVRQLLDSGERLLAIFVVSRIAATSGLEILREYGEKEAADSIEQIR